MLKHKAIDSFLHQTFIECLSPQGDVLDAIDTGTVIRKPIEKTARRQCR